MKIGGGRLKGKGFERDLASILTKWSKMTHKRTPLSGGWNSQIVSGDVFCVAEYNSLEAKIRVPVSWEAKCNEAWDLAQLFKNSDKSPLNKWWRQASLGAKQIKKTPILVFTKNYFPRFVLLKTNTLNKLTKLTRKPYKNFIHINGSIGKEKVTTLLLEDFLNWIPFETLLKLQ